MLFQMDLCIHSLPWFDVFSCSVFSGTHWFGQIQLHPRSGSWCALERRPLMQHVGGLLGQPSRVEDVGFVRVLEMKL